MATVPSAAPSSAPAATPATTTTSTTTTPAPSQTSASPAAAAPPAVVDKKLSSETANDPDTGDFTGLGEDFDPVDLLPPTSPTPVTKTESPTPKVDSPAAAAPAAEALPAPLAPKVETAEASVPLPAAATPSEPVPDGAKAQTEAPPASIDGILSQLEAEQDKIFPELVKSFTLDEPTVRELENDAAASIPKLMAKTYLNAVTTNLRYLQKIVPQMIQTAMMQKQLEKELETQFFTQWPKLNTKEHGADIAAFSQAIHSLNKNISRDDLFRQVGAAIMAKFAIPAGVPAAPAALAKAAPFVPAGIGTVVHSQPVVEGSPFDGLGEHFDDE